MASDCESGMSDWKWPKVKWLKVTTVELCKISRSERVFTLWKMKCTTAATIFNVYLTKDFNRCMYNNQFIKFISHCLNFY